MDDQEKEDTKVWLDIFRSVCTLHSANNSNYGTEACIRMADEIFYKLMSKRI